MDGGGQFFLKLVVSLTLLLMLLVVGQPFFSKMMQNFERTAVSQVVTQLNTAASFKVAEYIALDKLPELSEQLTNNPLSWLELDDLGGYDRYQGEVEELNFEQLDSKQWVYDRSTNRLVYKVKYPELLINEDPIAQRIQFRLQLEYSDLNEDGRFDADKDKITGLVIVPAYPYQWRQSTDN
jgi:hypothetical protein